MPKPPPGPPGGAPNAGGGPAGAPNAGGGPPGPPGGGPPNGGGPPGPPGGGPPGPLGAMPTIVPLMFTLGGPAGGGAPGGAPGGAAPGGAPGAGGCCPCGLFIISMVPLNLGAAPPLRLKPHFEQVADVSGFCVPQFGQNNADLACELVMGELRMRVALLSSRSRERRTTAVRARSRVRLHARPFATQARSTEEGAKVLPPFAARSCARFWAAICDGSALDSRAARQLACAPPSSPPPERRFAWFVHKPRPTPHPRNALRPHPRACARD